MVGAEATALVATGVAMAWPAGGDDDPLAGVPRTPTSADWPVRQSNPPEATPANVGDAVTFVADVTLPDCSHVEAGQRTVKVWQLKNTGTLTWRGYSLRRMDVPQQRTECQTIPDLPVPDTDPGEVVDVRATVAIPDVATFCFVRFTMMDGDGNVAFPGARPVNFQVIVD